MMKGMMSVLHPTFDALSAYADQSNPNAGTGRVGRHVATCAQCTDVVREIRELGESVRASTIEGAPRDLWSRIALAVATEPKPAPRESTPPDSVPWEIAPSLRPTRTWPVPARTALRRVAIAVTVATAALIVAVVVTQRTPPLYASGPSRFTISPARPAPGTTVHVRYQPPPRLAALSGILLVGQYVTDPARAKQDFYFGGEYDSLTVLRKTADGSMVGDLTLPANFAAVSLVVADAQGPGFDADGMFSWLLVGGDPQGRPVLRSLLAALSLDGHYGSRSRAGVLDTLQRYFPEHPAGFATADHYRSEGIFANLIKYFESAQRKYVAFDTRLGKQKTLDADRLAAMIAFARRIEEPGEAAQWTMRLVREHPDDPRALASYADVLHEKELRQLPKDSIAPFIPLLDSLYERSRVDMRFSFAGTLVTRYGDEAMQRRWALHVLQDKPGALTYGLPIDERWLREPDVRAQAASSLHTALSMPCATLRFGRLWWSAGSEHRYCLNGRSRAYADLSHIALLDGHLAEASVFSDSSSVFAERAGTCSVRAARRAKGELLLARGDTLGAARAFANPYEFQNWQTMDMRVHLFRRLAATVDSARWAALDAEAIQEMKPCLRIAYVRDSLERRAQQAWR